MDVGISEAKASLSKLIALAERGRETVITRNGKAVARLVPAIRHADRYPNAAIISRIERFSRTVKLRRRVNLRALIDEGRF